MKYLHSSYNNYIHARGVCGQSCYTVCLNTSSSVLKSSTKIVNLSDCTVFIYSNITITFIIDIHLIACKHSNITTIEIVNASISHNPASQSCMHYFRYMVDFM